MSEVGANEIKQLRTSFVVIYLSLQSFVRETVSYNNTLWETQVYAAEDNHIAQ